MKLDFMGHLYIGLTIVLAMCVFKMIEPLVGELVKLIKGKG